MPTRSVPTSVSLVETVGSSERYQRSVVAAAVPEPWLRTVALRVKETPAVGAAVADRRPSQRRDPGQVRATVTVTDDEQLFPVSVSSLTLSTQAP